MCQAHPPGFQMHLHWKSARIDGEAMKCGAALPTCLQLAPLLNFCYAGCDCNLQKLGFDLFNEFGYYFTRGFSFFVPQPLCFRPYHFMLGPKYAPHGLYIVDISSAGLLQGVLQDEPLADTVNTVVLQIHLLTKCFLNALQVGFPSLYCTLLQIPCVFLDTLIPLFAESIELDAFIPSQSL